MRSRHLILSAALGLGTIAGAFVVPAATLAAESATTPTPTTACTEGRWPASTQGVPVSFRAGARAGDYLWHSGTGWHIRFTHPGTGRRTFTGRIISNTPMTVVSYKFESGDAFVLSADHKTLTYRVRNYGRIDGLDFKTACATRLWFRGSMSGSRLPIGRIWIGHNGRHPLQDPFVITRPS